MNTRKLHRFVTATLTAALLGASMLNGAAARQTLAFCNLLTLTAEEIIGLHYTGVLADGFGTEANATPIPEDAVAAGGLHLEGPVTVRSTTNKPG